MSILKNCDNCEIFNENELYEECLHCRVLTKDEYDLNVFRPKEELIRQAEKNKFITLLKSDLEKYDGLADECVERKDIHELLENNAVRKYIESTIELLEKN